MISNARMYAVTPAVAAQWRALFLWVGACAGIPLDTIDHAAPLPLHALWSRPDLGSAFICGYPWATWSASEPRPVPLAAIVPSPPRYGGRSVYCSDIVVRSDAAFTTLADLTGRRFAFTTPASQSGYQAPRALFAQDAMRRGGALFAECVGPLVTPRAVVDAIVAGAADAGPLDSYWHDLLRRHEPETAAMLRVVVSTPMTPMPLLVAAAAIAPSVRTALQDALIAAGTNDELREVREALLIERMAPVESADYAILATNARRADDAGYRRLQ